MFRYVPRNKPKSTCLELIPERRWHWCSIQFEKHDGGEGTGLRIVSKIVVKSFKGGGNVAEAAPNGLG